MNMRNKTPDDILEEGNQKSYELYNEYANGRITINECIAGSNKIQEETLKKYREEVARILTRDGLYK